MTQASVAKPEQRFDVVVYAIETKIVDSIVGKSLEYHREGYGESATKRVATMLGRMNDAYNAAIVKTGTYSAGDELKDSDITSNDWSDSSAAIAKAGVS
jgi:hypothetical protein